VILTTPLTLMSQMMSILNNSWKIRIGDFDHSSTEDDDKLVVLDINAIHIHPKYVTDVAYFDVAILETKPIQLSWVRRLFFNY
jgi:hypothetical protein